MLVDVAYGTTGIEVEVPDDAHVIAPNHLAPASDAAAEIRRALGAPIASARLKELARDARTVAIAVCDATRPQPREVVVPALLDELGTIVDPADIVVIIATGTHRPSTEKERLAMFGRDLLRRVRVIDHDARDRSALVEVRVPGLDLPVQIARAFVEADLRITTGFVEPHFFAGFSGGPKLVAPGLAGIDTVLGLHDARRIGDPRATFGVIAGNPVHDDVRAIARAVGVHFALDVVLDGSQQLVRAFAGELSAMHARACELVRATTMVEVPGRFDIVVGSNAGWPLDQNLYQAVKGVAAACEVVKPNGLVLVAAECRDGLPAHGEFHRLLQQASSPKAFLETLARAGRTVADQWQAQVLARCQSWARIALHTQGVDDATLRSLHLESAADLDDALAGELKACGGSARVCVLPEGPRTIPVLAAG